MMELRPLFLGAALSLAEQKKKKKKKKKREEEERRRSKTQKSSFPPPRLFNRRLFRGESKRRKAR